MGWLQHRDVISGNLKNFYPLFSIFAPTKVFGISYKVDAAAGFEKIDSVVKRQDVVSLESLVILLTHYLDLVINPIYTGFL